MSAPISRPMSPPLSRIGFGVSGAHGTPLIRRAETIALIEQAVTSGITVLDTAPAYGAGEAERRVGAALTRVGRDRIHLMTKAGLFSHGLTGRRRDFSPDAIEASIRASLERLGVEGVDTFVLHGPHPTELTSSLFDRLASLRQAGAFEALGVAGRGAGLGEALEAGRFQAVMAPVHPFLTALEIDQLQAAFAGGIQVFAIETAGDRPPPIRAPRNPADVYRLARALRSQDPGRGRVAPMVGLKAALDLDWVTCALTTTSKHAHLNEILRHLESR